MNTDFLIRGSVPRHNWRFVLCDASTACDEAVIIHDTDPLSSLFFSQSLTAAILLAPLLTEDEKYSVRWQYQGPPGSIFVDVNAKSQVRGIPRDRDLSATVTDESQLFGDGGVISLIKSNSVKILNSGSAAAGLLNVVDDLAFFLSTSDQVETEMVAAIKFNPDPEKPVRLAAGFMLQAMPNCDLAELDKVRRLMKSADFAVILSDDNCAEEAKLRKIFHLLAKDSGISIDDGDLSFEFGAAPSLHCECDDEKMRAILKTMPDDELQAVLDAEGQVTVRCHFCHRSFTLRKE